MVTERLSWIEYVGIDDAGGNALNEAIFTLSIPGLVVEPAICRFRFTA